MSVFANDVRIKNVWMWEEYNRTELFTYSSYASPLKTQPFYAHY